MLRRFLERRTFVATLSLLFSLSADAQTGVRLNEVMASNQSYRNIDESITDWVELQNTTGSSIDLSGASLSDDAAAPRKWTFPQGSRIPANGYLVVLFDNSNPASTSAGGLLNTGFGLSASGETLYFFNRSTPAALIDSIQFGIQAVDYTIGRIGGAWALNVPTAGSGNMAANLGNVADLRVNEWMADPRSGDDWFELFNTGDLPINLSGLYLTDTTADKRKSIIQPHSYIGAGLNGFAEFIADSDPEDGANHVAFGLAASGERIGLYTAAGTEIDLVEFGQQQEGVSQGRLPDGAENIGTFVDAATPGRPNFQILTTLWINEVLSHSDLPYEDAVEIYNPGTTAVDISGWYLSDSNARLQKWRVPDNTVVPAGGYVVFYAHQFGGPGAIEPFGFSSTRGDDVYLAQVNGSGQLTGYVVREEFEPAPNGTSFGRYQTSVPGDYKFVAMVAPTFGVSNPASVEHFRAGQGAANTAPAVGPIVINEIMYHPQTNAATDNVLDEFVELYNITDSAVPLYDPLSTTNRWRLRDAVGFTFPENATLPAHGYALVVSFDPAANPTQTQIFRNTYNVPASVPLYGPFTGKLGNNSDAVEFYRPDRPQLAGTPDEGFVPYVRVDKVNYLNASPWPAGADGTGLSLQRKDSSAFGNDPINWEVAEPTAGRANGPVVDDFNISAVEISGGVASITFASTPGTSYGLQARDSLSSLSEWQTVASIEATGTVTTLQDPSSANRSERYYRVIRQE